jgi:hypothetical protein
LAFLRADGCEGVGDRRKECVDRPGGSFSQQCFELCEELFDGIEVGTVGRQVAQLGDALKRAAADTVSGDLGEEALEHVEPGSRGWREVQMKAGMRFDPVLHGRGFVSGVLRGREVTRVLPRPPGVHNAAWRRYGGVAARPCRSASIKQVTISGVLCGSSQESDNQEPEHDRQGSQESENQKSQHPGVASRERGTTISHGSANNDLLLRKSLKPSKEDFQQVAAYARSGHHGK